MKRTLFFGIIAALLSVAALAFVGCEGKNGGNSIVRYAGKVVYAGTSTPFPNLEVKVTNGDKIHCLEHTNAEGQFVLTVRIDDINGDYYVLAGDSTCLPKRVNLPGFGQEQFDLGTIEVEGPSLPVVTTAAVSSITAETATCGGNVTSDGRSSVTARGVCWAKTEYPTVNDAHTTNGTGTGEFQSQLTELEHNAIYYVRAYATNSQGTTYGEQFKFTTTEGVAVVVTDSVYNITAHTAKCRAHVVSDGGFAVTKRGICWSNRPDPTIDDNITEDGSGLGEYTATLKDLVENTTYYVRAYAINSTATAYGEQIIVTTLDGLAVVLTDSISSVTATTLTAHGTVVSDCDIPVTACGFCYATTQYPTIENDHTKSGKGLGNFQSNITQLKVGTTYYLRAYATNETGTAYGTQLEVTLQDGLPVVQFKQAVSTATSISVTGEILDTGGFDVIERGVCYSTMNSEPTVEDSKVISGKGKGTFSASITGLAAATTYYMRVYAVNENGTVYSPVQKVVTQNGAATVTGEIMDITALTASVTVIVTDAGGATLQSCGICWATTPNPTMEDNKTAGGNQLNTVYTCNMSGLAPATTYYIRAYATTDITTVYTSQATITTATGLPVLTTTETTATSTQITSGGNITGDGGYTVTARGVCYSTTNSTPTIEDSYTTAGVGTGAFSTVITDVTVSTTYYVRAYATNSIGTSYGEVVTVTTGNGLPVVITTEFGENVTETTAISGGQVTDDGGFAVTARGVCWSTFPYPTISDSKTIDGSGTGYYSSTITEIDLTSANTYYVRAYATNENGTSYGGQITITQENYDYKNLPAIEYGLYIYRLYPDMGAMNWNDANNACENLVYGGYDDWTLPTADEMKHIMTVYRVGWKMSNGTSYYLPSYDSYSSNESAYYWTKDLSSSNTSTSRYYSYCLKSYNSIYSYSSSYSTNVNRVRPVRKYLAHP